MLTDDIINLIADANLGVISTDLFVGQLPADTEGVLINEYGGESPTLFFISGGIQKPKIQVFTRYNDYEAGRTKIEDIYNLLKNKYIPLGTPAFLGTNENDQYEFSVNFKVIKNL